MQRKDAELSRETVNSAVEQLAKQYRDRALWFLREDFYPTTDEERINTLDYISAKCDLATFRRVMELKRWLLQNSDQESEGSESSHADRPAVF